MSLFGLGSFGEGFVTGFATEANEALKNSVKRINTRVDKLKDFQVQRAIKEQDKRAGEVEEHKEALQQAYALFDGDANAEQAIAYAGGLLKERGGLAAFKEKISELQKAKDNGTNIFNYFERAKTDAPYNATLDDIANAAVGARPTTATDYRLPEGMGDDSSLVGTILGKKIDVVGRATEQASQEIGALYGASVNQLVSLPTITFKSEDFSLSNKTPAEILDYSRKKLATPAIRDNPEAVKRYEAMRDAQEAAVVATKDQQATLNIVESQLNRLPLEQKGTDVETALLQKRQTIKDNIKMKSLEGDPVGTLDHKITVALRTAVAEAQTSGKPVDMTAVETLREEKNTLSGVVKTEAEEVAEDREAINKRTADDYTGLDKIDTSTPEGQALYEKEINAINARQAVLDLNVSPKIPDGIMVMKFTDSMIKAFEERKNSFVRTLDADKQSAWNRITRLLDKSDDKTGQLDRLKSNPKYAVSIAMYEEVEAARNNLKPAFTAGYVKQFDIKLHPEVLSAAAIFYPEFNNQGSAQTDATLTSNTVEKTEVSRIPVRTVTSSGEAVEEVAYQDGTVATVIAGTNTPVSNAKSSTEEAIPVNQPPLEDPTEEIANLENMRLQFPKTVDGASAILKGVASQGGKPEDVYNAAFDLHGDKQFATTVEYIASKSNSGVEALEKEIAEMSLRGLNANQITQQLRQVKYRGDTSMDVQSISSTVSKVLSQINPQSREDKIANSKRNEEAIAAKLKLANATPPALSLPSGLMSKR
tara:strand:+ start:2409 stop:4694 length:2286 start_codon:yes stop_codon:yes gene_type:complete